MSRPVNAAQFSANLREFAASTKRIEADLFRRCVVHVERSILYGDTITGAPGQPVKTERLRKSWRKKGSITSRYMKFYSRLYYAPIIENNIRGATLRSKVGGFHSVALTAAGWKSIVRYNLKDSNAQYAIIEVNGIFRSPTTGRFVRNPRA